MSEKTGVVKWFNQEKGFGFISCDDRKDLFVHHSQVKEKGNDKNLHEGQNVTFSVADGEKDQWQLMYKNYRIIRLILSK